MNNIDEFQLQPTDTYTIAFAFAIILVSVLSFLFFYRRTKAKRWAKIAGLAMVCLVASIVYTISLSNWVKIEIRKDQLVIKGLLFHEKVSINEMLTDSIQVYQQIPDFMRTKRSSGIRFFNIGIGWSSLMNKSLALVCKTSNKNVIVIPSKKKYFVILTVKDPQRLITSLKSKPKE